MGLIITPELKLTENFKLGEFAVSSEYPELASAMAFSRFEVEKLYYLCYFLLQPIAKHYHKPVIITSGKRTDELNTLIGGSKTSQHLRCEAADFFIPSEPSDHVFRFCFATLQDRWHQLILYITLSRATHLHISLPSIELTQAPSASIKEDGVLRPYRGE